MKVLVGCEFSGRVRDAFLAKGHDAVSCDLQPSESLRGAHIQSDVRDALRGESWDLAVLHPPCTHTAISGARWFKEKAVEQAAALAFIQEVWTLAPSRAALEQPMSITHRVLGPVSQVVQPWQFGHGETKATCLWLRGLPRLKPTKVVEGREAKVHRMSLRGGKAMRQRERSRTFPGIAEAMADQWGHYAEMAWGCEDQLIPEPRCIEEAKE